MDTKPQTFPVVVQKWEEAERGMGGRPDGYSLHLTETDRTAYVQEYWDHMPDEVPDEYERPDGTAYLADVDAATYEKVKESKNGRRFRGEPPGSGGKDGWVKARKD